MAGILALGGVLLMVWQRLGRPAPAPRPATAMSAKRPTFPSQQAPRADADPDVGARPSGRICGLVVDAASRSPVPGALVALRGPAGSATTSADGDGHFCFPQLLAGSYCLVARLEGRSSQAVDGLPLATGQALGDVALILGGGVRVSGRVRDHLTGQGVAGARVSARVDGLGVAAATTDGDGDYRLDGVGAGRHVLEVTARGYAGGRVDLQVDGKRPITGVDLWLDPGATLRGRVVDPDGKPVAGAVVSTSAYRLAASPAPVVPSARDGAVTAEDGTFHLVAPPGLVTLYATAEALGPGRLGGVQATAGATVKGLVIHLTRPAGLTLEVTGPDGRPVPGARIRVVCGGNLLCAFATAGEDGVLELTHLAPGAARVRADAPGLGEAGADVTLDAGLKRHLTLVLGGTGTIAGRLVGVEGRPISGAVIRLASELTAGDARRAVTGDDGTFLAQVPVQVPFTVDALWQGGPVAERRGVEAGDQLHLVARAAGRIIGQVLGPDGQPVTDFTVVAVPAPSADDSGRSGYSRRRFATDTGDFALDHVPAGRYRVRAFAPGAATSREVQVEVDPGNEAGPLRLVLGAAGRISGRVLDARGHPVAGARVSVDFGGVYGIGRFTGETGPVTESGTDGAFLLTDVPAGQPSRVFAYRPDHLMGAAGPVTVDPGADAGPVTIHLRAPPHTPPSQAEAFGGVGMTIGSPGSGQVLVEHVYEGGPAFFAGLRDGDVLLSVDGRSVEALGLPGTLQAIRGPVGSLVTLEVSRPTTGDHFVARVVRVLLRL